MDDIVVRPGRAGTTYRYVYVVLTGLWLSGALWLIYHFFFTRNTEFGPAPNPLEHWWLVAHGASAFASLWLMGHLWSTHIAKRWRLRRHRKTGATLVAVMAVLIASGYLLYYLSSDSWRAVVSLGHWLLGLVMPLALAGHWWVRARSKSAVRSAARHTPGNPGLSLVTPLARYSLQSSRRLRSH
jgi:hypothetical protein